MILQEFTTATQPASLLVQHKHTKILGLKGKRQISSLKSAERTSLVLFVAFTSPAGHFIPPLLVFRRKNMKQKLMNVTPPGSIHACHSSEWIQSEIFSKSFFYQTYKADKRRSSYLSNGRALLQARTLEVITLVRANHVDIIFIPPHSSHKKQHLEKFFMWPLKTFYFQENEKRLRSHPGRVVTVYQIGELFGNACKRTATDDIAVNVFRAKDFFPFDINISTPYDFPFASGNKDAAPVNLLC